MGCCCSSEDDARERQRLIDDERNRRAVAAQYGGGKGGASYQAGDGAQAYGTHSSTGSTSATHSHMRDIISQASQNFIDLQDGGSSVREGTSYEETNEFYLNHLKNIESPVDHSKLSLFKLPSPSPGNRDVSNILGTSAMSVDDEEVINRQVSSVHDAVENVQVEGKGSLIVHFPQI